MGDWWVCVLFKSRESGRGLGLVGATKDYRDRTGAAERRKSESLKWENRIFVFHAAIEKKQIIICLIYGDYLPNLLAVTSKAVWERKRQSVLSDCESCLICVYFCGIFDFVANRSKRKKNQWKLPTCSKVDLVNPLFYARIVAIDTYRIMIAWWKSLQRKHRNHRRPKNGSLWQEGKCRKARTFGKHELDALQQCQADR